MAKRKLKGKDILLLLLYLPGINKKKNEPIMGKTRITKMIFLFEKELYKNFDNISSDSLPDFFAYNYGPFSKDLLDDLRFFKMIGFITEKYTNQSLNQAEAEEYKYDIDDDMGFSDEVNLYDIGVPNQSEYFLTNKGVKYVEEKILNEFTSEQKNILVKFKKKINSLSLDSILSYVYNKYPDSAENSIIKDKYMKQKEESIK